MQENEKKEPCCCCAHKTKHRSEEEYKSLVHRLNRIEGQIRGIRGMVENEVYCPDILVQSAAVTAAIERAKDVVSTSGMFLDSSVIARPDKKLIEKIL